MSAPPPNLPNGQKPLPPRRRPRPADPLVARKKPPSRPRIPSALPGATAGRPGAGPPAVKTTPQPNQPHSVASRQAPSFDALRKQYGGWSEPPPTGNYQDFPVVTTKRALKEGIRYHIMRFHQPNPNDKPVDPTDQEEFTRPVTLQRRDPKQPPPGRAVKEDLPEPPPLDDKEAERLAQLKAEREAQKAIDQAKIAPGTKDPAPKRPQKQKDRPTQFFRVARTAAQKKEADLRYEEALPWHLEDADGKNVWVGQYIAQLSETNVAFVISGGAFRMIPLEKSYRMLAKPPFKPFSTEEAETMMKDTKRHGEIARWVMRNKDKHSAEEMEEFRRWYSGPSRVVTESSTFRSAARSEKADHNELDVSGDEFQDDDENPGFDVDNDEEIKDAMTRIRRNQLGANLFGDADEQEVDKEEFEVKREEEEREKFGKSMKKKLIKRERMLNYQSSDSDSNPFVSSSSGEDSDEEKPDVKNEDGEKKPDPDALLSGTSSKGNTTPSGKSKTDSLKKGKSLKRPGSPNLSESSGNESSRKRAKKQAGSVQQSRSSTPLPPGQRLKPNAGSTSDGEATAGEMSDGAPKKKRIKISNSAALGTPAGSRAGSPVPTGSGTVSPNKETPAGSPSGTIEAWEIVQALPPLPNGISISGLLKLFGKRVGEGPGQMDRKEWIAMVKENAVYGADKMLRRKK